MRNKNAILLWLAVCATALAGYAKDKDLILVDQYVNLSGHINKAKAAFQRNDLPKCEKEVLFCLEKLPEHHQAHFLLAQILYKKGDFEGALEHIEAAENGALKLSQALDQLTPSQKMKQIDRVVGLTEDAQAAALIAEEAKRHAYSQSNILDKAAHDAKEQLGAEESWVGTDQGKRVSPIPAGYHFYHGNDLFRLQRLPEAEAQYQLAIRADPGYSDAYNNLINVLYMQNKLDEALKFLAQAEAHKATVNPGLKKAVLEAAGK